MHNKASTSSERCYTSTKAHTIIRNTIINSSITIMKFSNHNQVLAREQNVEALRAPQTATFDNHQAPPRPDHHQQQPFQHTIRLPPADPKKDNSDQLSSNTMTGLKRKQKPDKPQKLSVQAPSAQAPEADTQQQGVNEGRGQVRTVHDPAQGNIAHGGHRAEPSHLALPVGPRHRSDGDIFPGSHYIETLPQTEIVTLHQIATFMYWHQSGSQKVWDVVMICALWTEDRMQPCRCVMGCTSFWMNHVCCKRFCTVWKTWLSLVRLGTKQPAYSNKDIDANLDSLQVHKCMHKKRCLFRMKVLLLNCCFSAQHVLLYDV